MGNIKRMGAYVCQGHPETVRKEAEWKWCIFLKNIFFQHFKNIKWSNMKTILASF
jgi:hypothetical protein